VIVKAWQGDWKARLRERVEARGFADASSFLYANVGMDLVELAKLLGDDVAAAQLVQQALGEAVERGEVERLARDLLARELRRYLPNGWRHHSDGDEAFARARAQGNWTATLRGIDDAACERVLDALNQPGAVPDGWQPFHGDDPLLVTIFAEHWKESN
jgi:hypothetical protein